MEAYYFIFHTIWSKHPDSGQELSAEIPTNISIPEDQSNGDEYMNVEQTGIHHEETSHHVIQQHEMLDDLSAEIPTNISIPEDRSNGYEYMNVEQVESITKKQVIMLFNNMKCWMM